MNLKDRILFRITPRVLGRNKKFAKRHEGESCYIFGNGSSIKHYDLKKFDDRIGIGCNNLFFHKEFNSVNIKYYYTGHSFLYYPFWTNTYNKKFERNLLGKIYKNKIRLNQDITYVTSLSDYFSMRGPNIYYCYHFGLPFRGFAHSRMDSAFTSVESGLVGMLGMAVFMGFTDVTLVGCDYLSFPQRHGRFFETGIRPETSWEKPLGKKFLFDLRRHADVRVLTLNESYRGHILPHVDYKTLSGDEPLYRENDELVSEEDLRDLNLSRMDYRIYP